MEWMIDRIGKGESISAFCSWQPAGLHRTLPWPIIPWDRWQSTEFCGLHMELCWEGWSTLVPSFPSFVVCNLSFLYINGSAVFLTSTNIVVAGGVTGCSIWSDRYGCMFSLSPMYTASLFTLLCTYSQCELLFKPAEKHSPT